MAALVAPAMPSTAQPLPDACLARLVCIDEWSTAIGGEAFITLDGRVVRIGVIELVTNDESIAWVAQSGAEPRQLVSKAEGHELWIAPRQLQSNESGEWWR